MKLSSIYTSSITIFGAEENINYPALAQLTDYLIDNSIRCSIPGGTTNEIYVLNEAKQMTIFQFVKN